MRRGFHWLPFLSAVFYNAQFVEGNPLALSMVLLLERGLNVPVEDETEGGSGVEALAYERISGEKAMADEEGKLGESECKSIKNMIV